MATNNITIVACILYKIVMCDLSPVLGRMENE